MFKRVLIITASVVMVFILSVTASAKLIFTEIIDNMIYDSLRGSSPITESDAAYAYQEYYDLTSEDVNGMLVFVSVPEYDLIEVWENAPNGEAALFDVVTYDEDGLLHSYHGWTVEPSRLISEMNTVIGGSQSFLELIGKLFTMCAENEICQMFLTVMFFGIGLRKMKSVSRAFVR